MLQKPKMELSLLPMCEHSCGYCTRHWFTHATLSDCGAAAQTGLFIYLAGDLRLHVILMPGWVEPGS